MSGVIADLRHAFRLYARTPASSALVIAGLAAALAIATAFLSLWNVLELQPHPGFEARRGLLTVGQSDGRVVFPLPLEVIERIDAEATTIESIAGVMPAPQSLELETKSLDIRTELVTANYFADVGPPVPIGRAFSRADHGANAEPVAILSHALWQREFGGDTDVLDQLVRLRLETFLFGSSGTSAMQDYRVIGVLGPGVGGTFMMDVDVWLPFEQAWPALSAARPAPPPGISEMLLRGLARLAPGATAEAARVELVGRFGPAPGQTGMMATLRLDAIEGVVGDVTAHREVRRQVRLFLAGSVLLTLVAACNVSLFLLSRAPARRRELAIRMTAGAVPVRLARQLVTESGVLVVAAASLGLAASIWLAALLPGIAFLDRLQWRNVTLLDWRVLALAVGVTLLLVMLVSLAPVGGLLRAGIDAGSRRARRGAISGQRLVGTVQVALATVVGGAAVAFIWHVGIMTFADRGFSAADVHIVRFEPPTPASMRGPNLGDRDARLAERERRRAVIGGLPGVASVTFATSVPGTRGITLIQQAVPTDAPDEPVRFDEVPVDPAYFAVLGFQLRYGRMLAPGEVNEVVVNETFAWRIWGRTDVVGELIPLQVPAGRTPLPREIVGVVRDVAFEHPNDSVSPLVFGSNGRAIVPSQLELVLIKSPLASESLRQMLDERIAAGELDLKIAGVEPVMAAWSRQLAPDRARAVLTAAAAAVVLLLAAVGYYGTQHYLVAAGRRDYAIFAAIGASPEAIHRSVLWRGLGYGLPGLVLGSVLAFGLVVRLRDGFITSDVSPLAVTVIVAVGIAGLLLGATSGPARQARDLEPAPLLKED